MAGRVWVKDRSTALWGGVACTVLGAALLHDAYEHRGKGRPFLARFLPG